MIYVPPYRPPLWLRSGHVQTIYPTLFRTVEAVTYRRERLDLDDGDFLDLDWTDGDRRRVAIVAHGLEGSADRAYVRGMARALGRRGWTTCAWNMRGCSGEPNRLLRAYHSGVSDDLDAVVSHVLAGGVETVAVVGFSLGGNVTLKWLGEQGSGIDPRVGAGVAVSVPIDLGSSADVMSGWTRQVYMRRFLRSLAEKARHKAEHFDDAPDPRGVDRMRTFAEFDGHFTAPVHGFDSAEDYWARASSRPLLTEIRVPTLLVQAQDDPFLSPVCFPTQAAAVNPALRLLTPAYGGHVGFVSSGDEYWSEQVAGRWLEAAAHAAPTSSASRAAPSSTA